MNKCKLSCVLFLCFRGVAVNVQDLTPSCAGALYGEDKSVVILSDFIFLVSSWFLLFCWHDNGSNFLLFCNRFYEYDGGFYGYVTNIRNRVWHAEMYLVKQQHWSLLHRTSVGFLVRLPDWGHPVVGHSFFPHHFGKCHGSWDLPHLWRCSTCRPAPLLTGYCGLTLSVYDI